MPTWLLVLIFTLNAEQVIPEKDALSTHAVANCTIQPLYVVVMVVVRSIMCVHAPQDIPVQHAQTLVALEICLMLQVFVEMVLV